MQLALRLHIETLETLQLQAQDACTVLVDTFRALPEAEYLLSVPGLGVITAATILPEIGNPAHFTNERQLVKLAGTQPVSNASGRKSRSQTPMSQRAATIAHRLVLRHDAPGSD